MIYLVKWSQEEKDILTNLWNKGIELEEIQKVLRGRTINAIHSQVLSLKLPERIGKPVDYDYYRQLLSVSDSDPER